MTLNQHNWLTTLISAKAYQDITASTDDTFLQTLISTASKIIEKYCRRQFRYHTYTEYHDGEYRNVLYLNQYPVISITSIYDDTDRAYGSDYLIDSDDYSINHELGIITLDAGYFNNGSQNVRAIYSAGIEEFIIESGVNDAIDFKEGGEGELTATLTAGKYRSGALLATEIDTQLTEAGALTYTVTYNRKTGKFTLTAGSGTFSLLTNTGTHSATAAWDILGFAITADNTAALTYTSDNAVLGLPDDIQVATDMLVDHLYKKSAKGGGQSTYESMSILGETVTVKPEILPDVIITLIETYRRLNI